MMDISNIPALSSQLASAASNEQVSIALLKTSLNSQVALADGLLAALPLASSGPGQIINTKA